MTTSLYTNTAEPGTDDGQAVAALIGATAVVMLASLILLAAALLIA